MIWQRRETAGAACAGLGIIDMNNQLIISKINSFLYTAASELVVWLDGILPRVDEHWWEDCVLSSLSHSQREIAKEKGFTKLSDFDLAALLRIANKSWYDMQTVTYLPNKERETVRDMMTVRNNWAHCGAELPGKDTIIRDLHTIQTFLEQLGESSTVDNEIEDLIREIEQPGSLKESETPVISSSKDEEQKESESDGGIAANCLVYLVGDPDKKGAVLSVTKVGETIKYTVFVDGGVQSFYEGQIAPVEKISGYKWLDISTFCSFLTAYQINNPSGQNLYSLNAARIDFVPHQFRPALKMIHADEPRILIADSVGVGKTIEAGLIIKELEARRDLERILIICPRPLVAERKWEMEMKRFDEEFYPLDGATLRGAIKDTWEFGEWPARYNKSIIPYSVLDSRTYEGDDSGRRHSYGLTDLEPAPHFDLVIVDEAHHIRNGSMEKEKAFAYKCTKYFCDNADAVVMLTATPLQTGDNDLFTLLNVLRPDVVIDKEAFDMMMRPNEYISKCARTLRRAGENWQAKASEELREVRKTQWGDNVIAENPLYDDILLRLDRPVDSREDRVRLISDVESLHSFNTMLNRTRRKDIQDFCIRRSHTIVVSFTQEQKELHDELLYFERRALTMIHDVRSVEFMISMIKRQAASCIFGLAPHIRNMIDRRYSQIADDPELILSDRVSEQAFEGGIAALAKKILEKAENLPDEDPKLEETLAIIRRKQGLQNNKVMLFSTFRHTLAYLKEKLQADGYRVAQIDGSVKDEDRYAYKERFEMPKEDAKAIDIMLFTEVGSEGLDYQFCDTMINYDLPWNPMKIEQRIGRIDRRGQKSEAVNIYNIITEDTVDADIYYRCLMRIGIFERSIGDCDEILGEIATQIESIAMDSDLTEDERRIKLEQMADNEVRKLQEMSRLEDEEKDLFGFDLSEFTTAQEIRQAENPWLSSGNIEALVTHYLDERVGSGAHISGDGRNKTLRLSVSARAQVLEDARKLPLKKNAVGRAWGEYLNGHDPKHLITFESAVAEQERECFFITPMHPLAKQAAAYFRTSERAYVSVNYYSNVLPEGKYLFSVYAWKFLGLNPHSKMVTVCEDDRVAQELADILTNIQDTAKGKETADADWSALEEKHIVMWQNARDKHREETQSTVTFRIETLGNNYKNQKRTLEREIRDAYDDRIRRMKMSELEKATEAYEKKANQIKNDAAKADVHTSLIANGILTIGRE